MPASCDNRDVRVAIGPREKAYPQNTTSASSRLVPVLSQPAVRSYEGRLYFFDHETGELEELGDVASFRD
ncbi:MAG: hypothetical protein AAF735_08070 [Myxococcota bacterium]